ncbi:hypothetical protein FUT69_01765 [Xylella taiwanensis]|nr:hypothetical protein [Xylella taiwanensis]MCD8457263.1 hypothetical protein [Xylella taiwanensis]MCD8461460.1 hypothetical protein [Xylella taiwanensis]MCD8466297.1 hypothetical protein [Xylella taiwanensis]MCD8468381.1 hypothetical protein [Xylella taiwanensis]MCD8469280.1 hypothetical protein [Xylella taiwanensis]
MLVGMGVLPNRLDSFMVDVMTLSKKEAASAVDDTGLAGAASGGNIFTEKPFELLFNPERGRTPP